LKKRTNKILSVWLFDRALPLTGGVAHSFLHLGRHSDRTRIVLHALACQRTDDDNDTAFADAGITPHLIGDRGYIAPALALRRLLQRHPPHIILCCSLKPYLLARAAAFGLPTRAIFWHVAITDILDGKLRTGLYRLLVRNDDVLANSHATADAHAFPGHRGRTRVVYLGVSDYENAAPAPRSARQALFGIAPSATVIAYTAGFVEYKKHIVLLDAFAILAPRFPTLHLVLIGVGPLRKKLMARATAATHGDRIHFVGARSDVRALLGVVDIYAHPAVGEGFGLAVVEAMLAGLPVVAARAGALPEIIDGTSNGLLCAPNDSADLAANLERLLDNTELRQSLGSTARATALARFAPDNYAAAMTGALEAFCSGPRHNTLRP
jgi:glycosyltransferase involved in cell wall biosynthesis